MVRERKRNTVVVCLLQYCLIEWNSEGHTKRQGVRMHNGLIHDGFGSRYKFGRFLLADDVDHCEIR